MKDKTCEGLAMLAMMETSGPLGFWLEPPPQRLRSSAEVDRLASRRSFVLCLLDALQSLGFLKKARVLGGGAEGQRVGSCFW